MKARECFQKQLLRRTNPDPLKVTKALEMAEIKKERAEDLLENDFFEESIGIILYQYVPGSSYTIVS